MIPAWPRAGGEPAASARIRCSPEDFRVDEELGFEPDGSGEHAFLQLRKRRLNTQDLVQRVSELSGIAARDIGFCGMKDREAVTSQWLSVRMAGRAEPDWGQLAVPGEVELLAVTRNGRKLKRGVHRANRFAITLREIEGEWRELEQKLQRVCRAGVPNYFGEQRFGRGGSTLQQARRWMAGGGRRLSRHRRGLYLSALRALLFNALLAERVRAGDWDRVTDGDVCMLQGSRSLFSCASADAELAARAAAGDLHPGLPLWGRGEPLAGPGPAQRQRQVLEEYRDTCAFLERAGLVLSHRPARVLADDFCWQFCDDGSLLLQFSLPAGSYATAVLGELARCAAGDVGSTGEQG